MLDGQPVEGVTVNFSPVDPKVGMAAVGTTDAQGKFKLTTIPEGGHEAGAPTGEYNVGFIKSSVSSPGAALETDDPNYGKEAASNTESAPVLKHEVPAAYNNPASSGMTASVKSGKNTDLKFDLKSK